MIERINLLPSRQRGSPAAGAEARRLLLALSAAALLVAALGAREIIGRRSLERRRAVLTQERDRLLAGLQTAAAAMGRLQDLSGEKAALQARLDALAELERGRRPWSEILTRISRLTPEGLWLTKLDSTLQAEGAQLVLGLQLTGKALAHDQITELLSALERDQAFRDVSLISTTRGGYLEHEVVDFRLACRMGGN